MSDDAQLVPTEEERVVDFGPEIEKDAAEYAEMENQVTQDFVQGLIKLGEILKRHKDKWKPQQLYTSYLNSINRSLSMANQIIRIYEYSINHLNQLLQVNLTNWNKVNMFLSLPDSIKDKLAEEIDGVDVTNDEFREKITEVKDEEIVVEDSNLPETTILEELVQKSTFTDIDYMAKQVVKELQNSGSVNITKESVPVASSFLHVEKAINFLSNEYISKLSKEEVSFWTKILKGQIDRLNNLLN